MPEIPHELIRKLQIHSRAAAGLSAYNPEDPTLPTLPPLAATIAALDPSKPDSRCVNCKGKLLRDIQSSICVYCGCRPQIDATPEPLCFTSTTGYQWLIHSLHLGGSEMVKPETNKTQKDQGKSSLKSEIPLSEFLNFRIAWPAQTEEEETSVPSQYSKESRRSFNLTGIAPDNFFFKSKTNASEISNEQPTMENQVQTSETKDLAANDNPNFFQNVQSPNPAGISFKDERSEAFSEWEAEFQSVDKENQQELSNSSYHFVDSSAASANKVQEFESFDQFEGSEVDLSAHMDSVFGPGKDLNDGYPKGDSEFTALSDWNSDGLLNNMSSNESQLIGGFENAVRSKEDHKLDNPNSSDPSTSVDLFQNFEWQTNHTYSTQNTVTNEEHKMTNADSFDEWNDFTGSSSLQNPFGNTSVGSNDLFPVSDNNSSGLDLFSSNNNFEGDFSNFSQLDLYSTSTSNSFFPAEVNATVSEESASKRSNDGISTSLESGQTTNIKDASGKSSEVKDEVANLISQMHDLSFMLESNLCIPSSSDTRNSSA